MTYFNNIFSNFDSPHDNAENQFILKENFNDQLNWITDQLMNEYLRSKSRNNLT